MPHYATPSSRTNSKPKVPLITHTVIQPSGIKHESVISPGVLEITAAEAEGILDDSKCSKNNHEGINELIKALWQPDPAEIQFSLSFLGVTNGRGDLR